ncbi:MAG: ATP-binding protein, partial [Polyangiaceae bacterium]|nr:ATP-binding protein [Polyangiaceae bacterium]
MRIRKIAFDGVRGLPDREFDLTDAKGGYAAGLVVVTGAQSTGKTSFLDAIVAAKESVGPYGAPPAPSSVVRPGEENAKIRVHWELSQLERERYGLPDAVVLSESLFGETGISPPEQNPALAALLSEYDADSDVAKVEYFHASRKIPLGTTIDLTKAPGTQADKLMRLEKSDAKYSGLVRFVVEAGLGLDANSDGSPKPPGRTKRAFEALCSTKRLGGLYQAEGSVLPGFFDSQGTAYGLSQLSDSELEAFLFAVTFVRSGLVGPRVGSLVLIDTPERYLGDVDAARFVDALARLGEENQLVVATRSREVAA